MIDLDIEQNRAVYARSPTIVNASAGSGKTRCLIAKIIHLVQDKNVNPSNICAVTFTNKAANEMKERLKQHIDVEGMQVSTIHSMCVRIMKKFIHHTCLNNPFSIYDDNDQASIVKTIIKSREFNADPDEILSLIGNYKSGKFPEVPEDIKEIYDAYQDVLFKNNACDFDDILVYAELCLRHSDCKEYYQNLWPHVLVDEFQDTSVVQYKIIKHLHDSSKSSTLFVIGDANQSIYKWRNANPENIQDFIKTFNPEVCYLTYNYRSCQQVISQANKYIQFGKPMIAKTATTGMVSFSQFSSQEEEASRIADAIQKMGDYENTAILFRVNTRTLLFERVFAQRRIPYKVIGALPFYKRKVAKDLLSYCKAAVNRSDLESLVRIVNTPKRGFGDKKQEQLLLQGWPYLESISDEIHSIRGLIDTLNEVRNKRPLDAINAILHNTGYRDILVKDNDRLMLDSFLNVVSGFGSIDELVLASNFIEEDSGHGVKLMTAHASKGLEFSRVFVVGVEDGLWPHCMSLDIEEEYRLFYVACTRAKKYLNISCSRSKLYRGQVIPVEPSNLFTNCL